MRIAGVLHLALALVLACVPVAAADKGGQGGGKPAKKFPCAGRDQFSLWGFDGETKHDGCYKRSETLHGLPVFTLRGSNATEGVHFSASDFDSPKQYIYWTIQNVGGYTRCVDFDFGRATFQTHPTQVTKWQCQGGGVSSMFTMAEFSIVCGCSGVRPNNLKNAVPGAQNPGPSCSHAPDNRLVLVGIFAFLVTLWLCACGSFKRTKRGSDLA